MRLIRTTLWLAAKDLRIELRSRTSLWSAVVLATVAVVIVGLSSTPGEIERAEVAAPRPLCVCRASVVDRNGARSVSVGCTRRAGAP